MQITLCEDDGCFFGGVPRNIVVVVKFDDGKTKRLPYPADRSISALYEDLKSIAPQVAQDAQQEIIELEPTSLPQIHNRYDKALSNAIKDLPKEVFKDNSNIIEKEDIVTLVKLDEGRNKDQTCLLVIGQELRVISVISTGVTLPGHNDITKIVQGYDVVDDKGDRPERTRVFPHEVQLLRKRTAPIIKKELVTSEILPCPTCNIPNALALDGASFKGTCTDCAMDISIERIVKPCRTAKCGNDVSCFDVGGKYAGKCNKCLSNIEVPYA